MIPLNPIAADQKTVAERQWQEGRKPAKPQKPRDIGLFSDDALQADLDLIVEMFQPPTNE
jgi:hypothetical protein